MKLTGKQARFVDEYLIDLNATQAAVRAGYSAKTARAIGTENLQKPAVQRALAARQAARAARVEVSQDQVLEIIASVVQDARRDLFDRDGNRMMINHTAALKGAELMGRHLGMFNDKITLAGQLGLSVTLEQVAVSPPKR